MFNFISFFAVESFLAHFFLIQMPNFTSTFDSYIGHRSSFTDRIDLSYILGHEIITAVLACLGNKFTGSRTKFSIGNKCKECVIFLARSQFKTHEEYFLSIHSR